MGLDITESKVSFTLARPLNLSEVDETIAYCEKDVLATLKIFEYYAKDCLTKLSLVQNFNLPIICISKTNAQITAKILGAVKTSYPKNFKKFSPPWNLIIKNARIVDFLTNPSENSASLTSTIAGIPHVFAKGGVHAGEKITAKNVWILNVASFYPSLMINYDFLPRSISPNKKELFEKIYKNRLSLKVKGDTETSNIYKIIINSIFGCMNFENSLLYDPENLRNVCISGQLMMADLVENLSPHIELINTNTDGIIFTPNNPDEVTKIYKDWEKRTRMKLELSFADRIIQKDVNNYILIKNNKIIKGIGAFVSKASQFKSLRQSLVIVSDAVVNFLAFKISPCETIKNCNNMLKFKIISKAGKSYDKVTWEKTTRSLKLTV